MNLFSPLESLDDLSDALQTQTDAAQMTILKPRNSTVLKKTVDALAFVPTRDKLPLISRKIYNVMMYYAQQQGLEVPIYRARLRDVINVIEFNSHNTEVLKEHLRQMVTTKVEWQSPSTGEGARWGVSAMISHAEIMNQNNEAIIEWSYSPTVKHAILDPERYAKISLQHQASLKTMAGLVLYEICARYVDNPGGVTARQPWAWWRPVLTGSPEAQGGGAYEEWKYFKRDVIKVAVAEVNRLTDLLVEPIEHKKGRSVSELQFKVSRKNPYKPLAAVPSPVNLQDIGRAIQSGVSQEKAEKLLDRHGEKAFSEAVTVLETRKARKDLEQVKSADKFISVVLENKRDSDVDSSGEVVTKPSNESKAARLALLERYRESKRREAESLYQESTEDMRSNLVAEFKLRVISTANPALQRSFASKGINGNMIRALFLKFLAEHFFGLLWGNPSDAELLNFSLG